VVMYASRKQAEEAAERYREANRAHSERKSKADPTDSASPIKKQQRDRLSYKEKRELEALPGEIERLESVLNALAEKLADPVTYQDAGVDVAALSSESKQAELMLQKAFDRWEELEGRAG